jgi:hypothetical protein
MAAADASRVLTIEGGLVRLQKTVVERTVRTADFVNEIARLQPLDTGVLPPGCVWFARRQSLKDQNVSVYVIERPPAMQSIRYGAVRDDDSSIKTLVLSWPNTLWFVRALGDAIQDVHLVATRTPLGEHGKDTTLFQLPMPNIYEYGNGAVCLGNLVLTDAHPLPVRVGDLVRQVLDSLWNKDLLPLFDSLGISGIEDWAAKSADDPEFHKQISYPEHARRNFGEMLSWLLEDRE